MTTIKVTKNIGLLLAGVWLLLYGVLLAFPAVQFSNWNIVLGLLAFVTGVLVVVSHGGEAATAGESSKT
jgi:uncharacterized membrane protein HdeD (DUF308 family)